MASEVPNVLIEILITREHWVQLHRLPQVFQKLHDNDITRLTYLHAHVLEPPSDVLTCEWDTQNLQTERSDWLRVLWAFNIALLGHIKNIVDKFRVAAYILIYLAIIIISESSP